MTPRFDSAPVLAGLKDFQRATVDHVDHQFFESRRTRRFLVADETGLGKSVVARGIVARTIERLQDDPTVGRIDIIYVCSNQDIAAQNLGRLDVTGGRSHVSSTRLSMLARQMHLLRGDTTVAGKEVNLVAFTPGTSFATSGWRSGTVDERALIFGVLAGRLDLDGWSRYTLTTILRGAAKRTSLQSSAEWVEREIQEGRVDRTIAATFVRMARSKGLVRRVRAMIAEIGRRTTLSASEAEGCRDLIGDLRHCLAQAGVERLEPDLVIFDEFQRFRQLLDPDEQSSAAELAHALFNYEDAKLLLLSATPYKPYTLAEESAAEDDHYADFRRTLEFLDPDPTWNDQVTRSLSAFRAAAITGDELTGGHVRKQLQELLTEVMTRTERPTLGENGMLAERHATVSDLKSSDVRSFVGMRRIAEELKTSLPLEYWKSAPYFLNFCDGYQFGERLSAHLKEGGQLTTADRQACQLLSLRSLRDFHPIDLGNARLRELSAQTLDHDWWRLLWMPPSMPYHDLGAGFARAAEQGATKRLVFSSWNATPSAVAALLSYEADRRIFEGTDLRNDTSSREARSGRLRLLFTDGRPSSLSSLALFWPQPALADAGDPLSIARDAGRRVSVSELRREAARRLDDLLPDPTEVPATRSDAADIALRWPNDTPPEPIDLSDPQSTADTADSNGWTQCLEWARTAGQRLPSRRELSEHRDELVLLALHAPGNVAWRALGRVIGFSKRVTSAGRWAATLTVADGLRTLFNRPETAVLLDREVQDVPTWAAVLRYVEMGGLQSVLDEYVHHVRSELPDGELDDLGLRTLADRVREALTLRASAPTAFNPIQPDAPIPLRTRFAVRYGSVRHKQDDARPTEVRTAFNSPFWPFVLTTTSAGQEGIDFHWWCSAVVHWNTPANPVDFEQREGRVNRFGGHAVRRNVANAHWNDVLTARDEDPWRVAYEFADRASHDLGEFAPYWVYPGSAKIERHVLTFPLSRDAGRYSQLKADLATYRLAFGQPRQEDLIEMLSRLGPDVAAWEPLDLRPQPLRAPGEYPS